MLALYCDTYASYQELTDFIREHGSSYTNEKGWQAPRPEVSLQTQKAKLMMIFTKEFGFTPGSQSRIAIVPQRDEIAYRGRLAREGRSGLVALGWLAVKAVERQPDGRRRRFLHVVAVPQYELVLERET